VLAAGALAGGMLGAGWPPAGGTGVPAVVTDDTVADTAEVAEGTTEDVAADTAPPPACVGESHVGEAGADGTGSGEEGTAGRGGSCAAAAGRAKITARIMASMKTAARPPQAHTQARGDQAPACFDSLTRGRVGAFPSTARKPRQALCYRAIILTA
jgi:hypothetical protein